MGDWEDLCESLGLTASASLEEVEDRLGLEESCLSARRTKTNAILSENDRPPGLPAQVEMAFEAAGHPVPLRFTMLEYCFRFTLQSGGRFDLWYDRYGRASSFRALKASDDEYSAIRQALQTHLPRPRPADASVWSRTAERAMRDDLERDGGMGLWIDHKPLKTQVILRRTPYAAHAKNPAVERLKRWAIVVIGHHEHGPSRLHWEWGERGMLDLLKGRLLGCGFLPHDG